MRAHRYRLPLAIVAAAVAATGATLLLRPRRGVIEPASATARDYFTAAELQRAHAYRGPQRMLGLGSLALSGAVLVLVVVRPPGGLRRALERAGARPIVGGAAAGAVYVVATTVIDLPLAAIAHQRSRDYGLATQTWAPWLGDVAKASAIGAVMTGAAAAIALGLIRRFPRGWWLPGSAAVVGLSTLLVFASPVVIDPLFNKFEPLPEGELRSEVMGLAREANVDVGQVYRVDASRRTTGTNAYVWGLGRTKRVVLYDNLIDDYPGDQVRSVVAHELSHVVHKDVIRGLVWLAIVAPAATVLVKELAERMSGDRSLGAPAALPALALAGGIASLPMNVASNVMSRRVEARADTFALNLTRDPDAFIGLERRLAVTNLADPKTPRVLQLLFGTHPTTMQRIGIGLEWAREH
jgi:STE24 endopeptidase